MLSIFNRSARRQTENAHGLSAEEHPTPHKIRSLIEGGKLFRRSHTDMREAAAGGKSAKRRASVLNLTAGVRRQGDVDGSGSDMDTFKAREAPHNAVVSTTELPIGKAATPTPPSPTKPPTPSLRQVPNGHAPAIAPLPQPDRPPTPPSSIAPHSERDTIPAEPINGLALTGMAPSQPLPTPVSAVDETLAPSPNRIVPTSPRPPSLPRPALSVDTQKAVAGPNGDAVAHSPDNATYATPSGTPSGPSPITEHYATPAAGSPTEPTLIAPSTAPLRLVRSAEPSRTIESMAGRATGVMTGGGGVSRRRSSAMSVTSAMSAYDSPHGHGQRKRSFVLQSPPMPQPIANLPTLSAGAASPGAGPSRMPEWGALALEGGPKSPSAGPHATPHANGYPFFAAPSSPTPVKQQSKDLTDAEIRKATKSMPVMLRVPSRPAAVDEDVFEDDGGEAEDDDDDESEESSPSIRQGPPSPPTFNLGKHPMTPVAEEVPSRRPSAPTPVDVRIMGSNSPKSVWNLANGPHSPRIPREWSSFSGSTLHSTSKNVPSHPPGYFDNAVIASSAGPSTGTPPPSAGASSAVSGTASELGRREVLESPNSELTGTTNTDETIGDEAEDDGDEDSIAESDIGSEEHAPATVPALAPVPAALSPRSPQRPALYSQASQSMINLPTGSNARANGLEAIEEPVPNEAWAHPPPTPAARRASLLSPPTLKRRLSASDLDPPKYEPHSWSTSVPLPGPRDEEGRERLPGYWCGVHIEGTLSRKMEFMQPGVQARDRGWKKYYLVLHGTALYVYKFDPCKVPLRQGEVYQTCTEREAQTFLHVHTAPDRRTSMAVTTQLPVTSSPRLTPAPPPRSGTNSGATTPQRSSTPLQSRAATPQRQTRRNTIGIESALQRTALNIAHAGHRRTTVGSANAPSNNPDDDKDPSLFNPETTRRRAGTLDSVASSTQSAPIASHLPFAHNQLVHIYSLVGAESGLAADYKKRLHCVRVRAEGQQFMLQTETARQCVQWIEAFQAATNVAQDLDVRPMPVQQTLPRRRRRVARPRDTAAAGTTTTDGSNTAFQDTPAGNIAAVEAAERAQRDRDRMLAEDQAAAARE